MRKSIAKVTNQLSSLLIVSTLFVIMGVFVTHRITVASLDATKKELAQTHLEQALESYRLGLVGNVAMIANLKLFLDFTRSGPVTRKSLQTEMLQSLGQLKRTEVIGIELFLESENEKVISIGELSSSSLKLKLCYFGDILSSEFGECNASLVLYLDSLAITEKIIKSSPDIEQCFDCQSIDLFRDFKSKVFKIGSEGKVPVYARATPQDNGMIFILFEISIILLILIYVYWVRRKITAIVKLEIVEPILSLSKKISENTPDDADESISELLAIEANYLRGEAILQTTQMLAHDVRKPFTMIKGLLNILVEEKNANKLNKLIEDYVPEIDRAIFGVDQMISDVMNMGVKPNIRKETVDPAELLYFAVQDILKVYDRDDVSFAFNIEACRKLFVDSVKVKRVLSNIIANALQVMQSEASIMMNVRDYDDSFVEIEITNTGSFICADKLSNIFDSFYTFGKSSGTGLGLAIAKKFIEAHGGQISCLSSEKMNRVSFFMTLPAHKSERSISSHRLLKGVDFKARSRQKKPNSHKDIPVHEKLVNQIKSLDSKKYKLLIVDDDPIFAQAIKATLIGVNLNEHFTIESSHSAATVLTDPKCLDADFLICDIDFESETVSGIDVVKHFRENSNGVKIALHSNRIEQSIDDIVQAFNLTFLSKPIDEFELLNFSILDAYPQDSSCRGFAFDDFKVEDEA